MCDWLELGKNILIGLVSGGISSWIVTALWQKKMDAFEKERQAEAEELEEARKAEADEREYKTNYYNTVQILCRYLDRLQTELDLKGAVEKAANIRRLVDSIPSTPAFTDALTEAGEAQMSALYELRRELDKAADCESISDETCEQYRRRLFQFECNFLKNQTSYLRPYGNRDKRKRQ